MPPCKQILLTDEEIENAYGEKYSEGDIYAIARAQLKKVVEWGYEVCPHVHKVMSDRQKHACGECWQSLLEEVNEG